MKYIFLRPAWLMTALLTALLVVPSLAQQTPAPQQAAPAGMTPSPVAITLDTLDDSVGIAQQAAHSRGLQGRILWMDAGANVGNLNSVAKIQDVINKVKASGMNMIVLDVKPIVGDTIYPSKFAPKLTEWKGQKVAANFDVLRHVLDAAHTAGIPVYANMSTFGEGHKLVKRGLAYTHPDWQTILYEVDRGVYAEDAFAPISVVDDLPPSENAVAALTSAALLRKDRPGDTVAVVNFDARVLGVYDGANLAAANLQIPPGGAALIGTGKASRWLQQNVRPGMILTYVTKPKLVPVADAPEQKYTMFCNPINPEVRQHELDIVREIVTNYDVDGLVFDDRLRYAAINADFSALSRKAFAQYVGHTVTWPDDVFRISPYPGQAILPGPDYQQWLNWRAGNIKSWVAEAAQIVRSIRPQAQVSVYVGSWYQDYEKVGSNWAATDFTSDYSWLTPEYQQAGYADLLNWLTTGCYYQTATIEEAKNSGVSLGANVEAAGMLSNRVVNDAAWTYAGLYALTYQGQPDQFARAIRAAAASSQGVMVFDMSQIIQYDWWHVLADAFASTPAQPPNTVPGLLEEVHRQHAAGKAAGIPQPLLPPFVGVENTGF